MFLPIVLGLAAILNPSYTQTDATPAENLKRLMEGNSRFVTHHQQFPHQSIKRRESIVQAQQPMAIIVSCSDSRVPPEIIFDQGLGDLFVARVAGNVIGPIELDTIEYAAHILKVRLILIMGHENSGAMRAVLNADVNNRDIENIIPLVLPLVSEAKAQVGDPLTNLTKLNVKNMIKYLKATDIIGQLVRDEGLKIVGAYYSLESGQVELLDFFENSI